MEDGDATVGGKMLSRAMNGGTPARIPATEIYNIRSDMFEIEARETLWLDRIDHPWAVDIARVLEKLAVEVPATASVLISDEYIALKVAKDRRVEVWRDGTAIIRVPDCVLVADSKFLLMCMDKDGFYEPVAKAELITWSGTEEYFAPIDIYRDLKQTLKRVLERARWL